MKLTWRHWAKALGQKASKNDRESDHVAIIRTVIFLTYLITNLFIVAGVIRHWNDSNSKPLNIHYYEIPSDLLQKQKEKAIKASCNIL